MVKRKQSQNKEAPVAMTVREAGKKGGNTVKERYGAEFFEEIGKQGGEARKKQLGRDGYRKLGIKGGQRVRELIEEGKRAAAREE